MKRISREEAQRCLAAEGRGVSTELLGRGEAGGKHTGAGPQRGEKGDARRCGSKECHEHGNVKGHGERITE